MIGRRPAAAAFKFAAARRAAVNGTAGAVLSRRLQQAVVRALTDHGRRADAADRILRRRFNATVAVDIGYTRLTDVTTYEDRGRFMAFRPRELLCMLEAWGQTPPHLFVAPGLRYVIRRQQGLNHPYYGSTTAVSWPTNRPESYQEYMDFSFNNDGYTARHLFLHEKSHFLWSRAWTAGLRRDWAAVGGWAQPDGGAGGEDSGWRTDSSAAFVSDYGAGSNPNEDMAEDLAAYVLHPRLLRARAPAKLAFLAARVFRGVRYIERAPHAAVVPESAGPFLRYPPTITKASPPFPPRPHGRGAGPFPRPGIRLRLRQGVALLTAGGREYVPARRGCTGSARAADRAAAWRSRLLHPRRAYGWRRWASGEAGDRASTVGGGGERLTGCCCCCCWRRRRRWRSG